MTPGTVTIYDVGECAGAQLGVDDLLLLLSMGDDPFKDKSLVYINQGDNPST